jgi:DNA mismatch repair ATPase MutS
MILHTDDQTIEDLRLFSKRDTPGIFDLYNDTHTRGAEELLRDMFRSPLCNREEINRRSNIIEHFCKTGMRFPFEPSLFDMAEKYLTDSNDTGKGGMQQSMLSEKEILNGVTSLISLVQQTKQFLHAEDVRTLQAFAPEREEMEKLLADPALEPVLNERSQGRISFAAVTAFDVLLRVRERSKIEKLMTQIYLLDVYISVAMVAAKRNFVFPVALDNKKGELKIEGLYHPELKQPVPNDIAMDQSRTLVFLTGANMAGKSTFLRSLATAVYIAHMGFPVAAKKMEFSVMDGIYTTINLPDNLGIGASHFYAEVLRVKKVATALSQGKSLFIIFDELFRGTNVKDAHEASVAIALAFAGKMNSRFIISSHIVEAADKLATKPNIDFLFLPTRMNGHVPEYTYTLEHGVTNDRHGMIIIRNEGILETLKHGRKRAM